MVGANYFIYATELISSLTGLLAEINQYISMFGVGEACAQRDGISAVAAAISILWGMKLLAAYCQSRSSSNFDCWSDSV